VVGMELWAEIRRLYFVEKRSKRAIHRLTDVYRDTITRAIESAAPAPYVRASAGSKLDPDRWTRPSPSTIQTDVVKLVSPTIDR
jgi:hypothetical protein